MAGLAGFREQYPQYADVPDAELADSLHAKFYSDIPKDQYLESLGMGKPSLMSRAGAALKPAEREPMPSTADTINAGWTSPPEERLSVPGSVMDGYTPSENGQGLPVEAGMGPMRKDYYDQTRAGLLSAPVEKHAAAAKAGGQVGKIAAESLPARVVANERAAAGDTQARTMQELGDQTNASLTAQPLRTEATKEANRQWLTENSAGAIEGIKRFTKLDQADAEAELQQMIRYGVKPSWVDSSTPDATLMQAASANIGATGPALQKALLGLSEAAADQPMLQLPWMDYAKRTPRQLEMTVTNLDKQIRAARNVGGKIEAGSWNDVVSTIGPSLATNMPPLIAAALVAAKNPAAGMAIANGGLGVMGMQKFGDNYLKGQMKGLSAADNLTQASLGAAAEVIPEKLSLNSLFAAFKTLGKGSAIDAVKAFAKQQLTEHSTEQITTIADHLIDKAYTEPNKSIESLWSEMKQTAMATAIQAPLLAAGGAAAHITGQAVVGAKQRFDENRDITAGMQFDPGQIDAAARQALDPANAQMRQVGTRAAPVPPRASTRAELDAILASDKPVAEILAAQAPAAPQATPQAPLQPAAFGWPDIKTPAVATLPDGQIITGQIAGIQDSDGQPMARFVGADGQVWMLQPGEADIKLAPAGDGTRTAPVQAETAEHIKIAEQQVDTNPTEAMKDAGNYKLGHLAIQGLDIAIENPAGSVRSGVGKDGKPWANTLNHTYGYIKGATAADGDKLDAFIGPDPQSQQVFVIDQIDPDTGRYDEAKTMLGFNSLDEARAAYLSNYDAGWKGVGAITPLSMPAFKAWIAKGETHKPLAYDQKAAIAERKAAADTQKAGEAYAAEREKAVAAIGEDQVAAIEDQVADQNAGQPTIELYRAIATALKAEAARQATKPAAPAQTPAAPSSTAQPEPAAAAPTPKQLEMKARAAKNIDAYLNQNAAGRWQLSQPIDDADLRSRVIDEMDRRNQGEVNAQDQAVQSQPAVQDVPQAAPEAGALPGELTPGTPEYNAYFEKKAAAEQEKRDADQREQRRSEGQAAVDKKNSWRKKLLAWFDGAKDGDTITTDMAGDDYRVIEKTIDRNGKKIQSKRLVQVGGMGEGRDKTVIEHRDGKVYQGPNTSQTIDPSAGFAQAPETDADGLGARLGQAMEDGRAKVGAGATPNAVAPNIAPQAPNISGAAPAPEERAYTKGQAEVLARRMTNQGLPSEAYPHPTQAGMWAIRAPGEEHPADAGADFLASNRAEFRHEGFRIYPISIKGEPRWAVQSLDNSEKEKKGERQIGGDAIVDTPEQAKQQAESQVTERGQKAERQRQFAEQDAAEEAKKEANRGLSITQRRANAALDKPTNLPVNAGVGRGTRREAMESAVSQERAINAVDVRDTAAYKRDEDEQGRLHRAGYGAFFGNDSHPQKMRFNELSAKLKNRDNYQKKEYRLYMGRDTEGSFYDITKTEYDYAQTLIAAKKAEASTPAPSTPTAKKEPWQYGELEYGDKYIDEVVLPQLRKDLENAHGGKFQEYKSKAAAVRGLKERIDTLENHRDAKARKYYASLDDHYAAVRGALAAGKDVPPVAYESYDDLKADVSAGRIKGDGQEVMRVLTPKHIEAGKTETATVPVIAASIKESAKNTPMNIEQAREWLLKQIDAALIDAKSAAEEDVWDRAEGKVDLKGRMDVKETIGYKVFDVPGDGRFSVLNLKESLQKFKKQVAATPGFKKNATRPMSVANGSGGKTSVRDMLEDGEYVLAVDYGRQIGEPLLFGAVRKGEAHPIAYTNAEPVDIKGIEAQVGREWNVTGKSFSWRVIETTTGVSVSSETTKERAVSKAKAYVDEHGADKLIAQIKETPKVSQSELERQFTDWGSEEEAKAQKTRDAVERADTEDRALWNSIFPLKDGEKRSPNPWNDIDHMQAVVLAKDADKAGKGDEFVSLIERRRGGTNNMLALAARKALADAAPKAKPAKGSIATGVASKILGDIYQRAAYNKWTWDRLKSYLTREMEASGVGKSRMANALEKAMTEYARTANGRLGYPNSNLVFSAMRDYGLITEDAPDAQQKPGVDYKGFERTPTGNGNFTLKDGNLLVKVEAMGNGKFQASHLSAKSSPHIIGEQGAVEWAANIRETGKPKTTGYPFYSNNKLYNAEGTAELPKDWTGVAMSDSGKRFFYLSWENGERAYNPLQAKSYDEAVKESAEKFPATDITPPEGYKKVSESYFGGSTLKPVYAPFADGDRVWAKEGGYLGTVDGISGAGQISDGAFIKFDNGSSKLMKWAQVETAPAASVPSEAAKKKKVGAGETAMVAGYPVSGMGDKALAAHAQSSNAADRAAAMAEIERRKATVKDSLTPEKAEQQAEGKIDTHESLFDRLRDGTATLDEFKAGFVAVVAGKEAITAELSKLTKDAIFKRFPGLAYRYKTANKAEIVDAAYRDMASDFALGRSISYVLGFGGDGGYFKAITAMVERTTEDDLAKFAADVKAAKAERAERQKEAEAGMENPVTLDDYKRILGAKAQEIGEGATFTQARIAMTPEQRARFDELSAEKVGAGEAATKDRFEYPNPKYTSPSDLPAMRAVVDYMNGDITRDAMTQIIVDSGLPEGTIRSITNRLGDDSYSNGEIADIKRRQAGAKEPDTGIAFNSIEPSRSVKIDPDSLSREVLSKMDKTLKAMGYNSRGPDAVRETLKNRIVDGQIPSFMPDWITAYEKATGSAKARVEKLAQKKMEESAATNVDFARVRELGTTTDLREAGYIRANGALVDLSGKREGGSPGQRSYDHREVGNGSKAMQEFMALGNIRMDMAAGTLDISAEPTSAQESVIRQIAAKHNGELVIDLEDGLGEEGGSYYLKPERHFSQEYPVGTKPERILADIRRFFAGEIPVALSKSSYNDLESDHQSAVSRAIDRAIAIEQGKDVKPLQVLRVRNRIGKLRADLEAGKISEALFISQVESLHAQMEIAAESRRYAPTNGRARGADFLRQKLLEAKRRGDISEQAADMAEWFILKNPALVDDLGIGIRTPKEGQAASGNYNPLNRVMTLFKESASDTTAIHEILHHLERMMPAEMQAEIRKEWRKAATKELLAATKAKDQKRIAYFEAVLVGNMARATKLLTGEMGWFSDTGNAWFESQVRSDPTERRLPPDVVAKRAAEIRAHWEKQANSKSEKNANEAKTALAMNDYRDAIQRAHTHKTLTFTPLPGGAFSAKGTRLVHQSPGYGKKQGSSYRIVIVNGEPAYAREADHWGKFHTQEWRDGEQVATDYNWTLDGVPGKNDGERRAGYILLRDLPGSSVGFNAVEPAPTFKAVDTESAEFKHWFEGSAVTGEDGKPLRVYHGTPADFAEFDHSKTWSSTLGDSGGLGFFFSESPEEATHYANRRAGSGPIMQVYLSIKNPKTIEKYSPEYDRLFNSKSSAIKLRSDLIEQGYDGAITHLGEYVAFDPAQIKSAISNSGRFDPTNPDIRQDLAIGQDYQYLNPSEFWAVRMTSTMAARFEAKSIWARSLQWLKEVLQHIKGALGLKSDHPLLKALDDLIARGTGEFQSKEMLGSSEVYASIEESGPEEVAGVVMRDASLAARLLLHPRQIAANHKPFVPVFDTAIKQFEERDRIVSGLGEMAKPYFELTHAQRLNVNKIVEQGRLDRTVYTVADLENGIHHAESGDLVTLDAEEIGAYKSLRKTFNEALSLFRDTMLEEFGFSELIPEQKAAAKLRQMIADGEIEESRIEWARHVAKAIDEIEQAKRTGYAPFNRYGQFVVAVKALPAGVEIQDDDGKQLVTGIPEYGDDPLTQIVTDMGGQYDVFRDGWVIDDTRKAVLRALETTLFATKVEVNAFNEWRKQGKDVTAIPEVKAAFDEAKRKYGNVPNARVLAFHITEKAKADDANLSTFDELARISDVDVETWDAVREKLQEAIKAKSFRKHFFGSDNTPGYSVDFERSVADYIIGMSGYLARRKHVKDFDNAIKHIKAPALAKYAEDYRKYVNAPADEFALLKNIGFLYYIAGSTATAVANLTQVPMLTMPTLVQFVPYHIAAREVARAWGETLAMFSPTKTGLQMFDPAKVPADVRDVFKTAWEDQLFVPLETLDLMAASSIKTVGGRKTMRALSVTTQAIAYMFMFAERLNRITTFIAAARISRMKVAKDRMRDVVKNDAWARHSIGGRAWGERNFAEWAVDESQYRMGKVNRPTVMRGVGSPLLQFKGYMIQTLEAGYRMAVMHGKGGKPAALAALAMMLMLGGLWGLPGLEDLREMIERLYKVNTGKDLDLKTEVRQLIARKMGSAALAAAANKGIPYATVGMDMSRVGLGNIIPDSALQVAGIPVDLTIARPMRAAEKMAAGKTTEAMSEFLPNFLKNPAMGLQWKRDGLRDKYGSRMMTPGEFDYADVAIKSLGWTPTKVTNRREYTYAESRAERGIDELKRRYTNDLVRAYVHEAEAKYLAEKAEYKADQAKILAKIEEHNKTASPENLIKLDPGTLRRKAAAEFSGSAAREGKERKLSRGAAQDRRELFQLGR